MASCKIQESKRKARRSLNVLGMNDDLWDRVLGLGRKSKSKEEEEEDATHLKRHQET